MNGTKNITVPAASGGKDGVYTEKTGDATVFGCVAASGVFKLQVGNDEAVEMNAGDKQGEPGGEKLRSITITNPGSSVLQLKVFIGNKPFTSAAVIPKTAVITANLIVSAGELTIANNDSSLPIGTTITDTDDFGKTATYNRTICQLTNMTANRTLDLIQFGGAAGEFGAVFGQEKTEVPPGISFTLDNTSAASITVRFLIFWDKEASAA